MISFRLSCENGHPFEGWFRGSDDFTAQSDKGLLSCPVCGSTKVEKALMAPNVSTARGKEKAAQEVRQAIAQAHAAVAAEDQAASSPSKPVDGEVLGGVPAATAPVVAMKDLPEPVKAYREAVRKLRGEVEASSEDVGRRFVDEARKMHYGEAEERAIRGEASLEDAAALDEEGIDVFVLPTLPEDGH
ncbi:MAG: DUF1178 family protein [Cohaesibacteraceae bacterium]